MEAILICMAVIPLVVLLCMATVQSRRNFNEHFPPISDAEFLARCKSGTNPQIALKVRRIVADHFAIEYERVHPSMSFIEDLGVD